MTGCIRELWSDETLTDKEIMRRYWIVLQNDIMSYGNGSQPHLLRSPKEIEAEAEYAAELLTSYGLERVEAAIRGFALGIQKTIITPDDIERWINASECTAMLTSPRSMFHEC